MADIGSEGYFRALCPHRITGLALNAVTSSAVISNKQGRGATEMDELHKSWLWFFVLGIITLVLGTLAVVVSFGSSLAFEVWIGMIFVVVGVVQAVDSFWPRRWPGFFFELFGGVYYLLVGLMLLANPNSGVVMFTLLLALLLIMQGMVQFGLASELQPGLSRAWMFASGTAAVLLGVVIWVRWPSNASWLVGLLVGVHLLLRGWSVVVLALSTRRLTQIELLRLKQKLV